MSRLAHHWEAPRGRVEAPRTGTLDSIPIKQFVGHIESTRPVARLSSIDSIGSAHAGPSGSPAAFAREHSR